jgi:GxxExxY protein
MEILHKSITDKILRAFYNVYNKMGHGFSEKVYENSLLIELRLQGLTCQKQKSIDVYYDEQLVGEYFADIVVEELIILELKAGSAIIPEHEAQLLNYLRATKIEVGFLLNFGENPQFKRMVFLNERKVHFKK